MAGITYAVVAVLVLVKTGSLIYAADVVFGPFAGGVARGWQRCCAQFSLGLAPWGLVLLAGGILVQFRVAPTTPKRVFVRKAAWALAVAAWFTLALVSYAHALE